MKFQTKMTLCVMLLLAVVFGVGNSLLLTMSFQNSLERERSAAYHTYQMLLYSLDALDASPSIYADMHNTLYQLDAQSGGWPALRLKSGSLIVYTSASADAFQNDLEGRTDLRQCSMRMFPSGEGWFLQITGRFLCGGAAFTLDALYPLADLYHARAVQLQNYCIAFCVVAILGAVMSWLISRWLTMPLRKLSLILRRITAGDLTCRAEVGSSDELGALARDLNHMTGRLEANIDALKDAMRRQEEFMGSFAHELKTPMTAIIGYADLLRGQALTQEEGQEAANYIFQEGRRLERLSLKLLELLVAQKGGLQFTPCRPKVILEDAARLLGPKLTRQQITLRYTCGSGICFLEPDLTRSLLTNLIDNARKAIDGPGAIEIEAEVAPNRFRFQIRDTGRGMAQSELSHIQEPFYRVDKSRSRHQGGAGLGLTLCREIVALHQGTISFESAPGQGTCVTVELKGGPV